MAQKQNRRDFLKQGVIAGTGFVLGCSCLCGCSNSQKSKRKEGKTMEKMIAFCGLICSDCPAFIATQKNDDEQRRKVAELWSMEEHPLKAKDINCDGCLTAKGRLIWFSKACDVRRCGFEKNVKNCAYCSEYPCVKLDKPHSQAPEAKATLDEIRKNL